MSESVIWTTVCEKLDVQGLHTFAMVSKEWNRIAFLLTMDNAKKKWDKTVSKYSSSFSHF